MRILLARRFFHGIRINARKTGIIKTAGERGKTAFACFLRAALCGNRLTSDKETHIICFAKIVRKRKHHISRGALLRRRRRQTKDDGFGDRFR
ncbi:MAG: hypothetical protein LUG15_00395, partial [Oscillospiraceae bacterium]|nr:hypothetical protein [Oscillospiraceae bacterium]